MATPRAWVNILAHSSLTTESGDERSYGLVSVLTHAEEGCPSHHGALLADGQPADGYQHFVLAHRGEAPSSISRQVSPELLIAALKELDNTVWSLEPGRSDVVASKYSQSSVDPAEDTLGRLTFSTWAASTGSAGALSHGL